MSEFVCHTDGVNADRKELDKDTFKTGIPHRLRHQPRRQHGVGDRCLDVTATVPVGKDPHWVAVDPTTHTAYVTNRSTTWCG
jgi:hypothetical protein